MSAPTWTVKLDDGSGAWATTITTLVRMRDGASISSYGRTDENTQTQPASLTFTLDNADGRFTNGTVTLTPNQTLVRFTLTSGATTDDRFTGRIVTLAQQWPDGGQEFATVTVTAVDYLADLGRQQLFSMLAQENLALSPEFYYTLNEADGSTSAGDTTGNHPPLTSTGSGVPVQFGQGTGPVDGGSAAVFAGGKYLATSSWSSPTIKSFGCWFVAASTPASTQVLLDLGGLVLTMRTDGFLGVTDFAGGSIRTGSTMSADGSTHSVMVVANGTTVTIYLDGADDGANINAQQATTFASVGGYGGTTSTFHQFQGTISHVVGFTSALTAPQIATVYGAGSGTLNETTDARLSRLASYAGLTATTTSPSGQIMGAQATNGQSLFDAMQQVALAEGGVFYADGSGVLRMQGRYYRSMRTTPDLVLTSDAVDPGTSVTWDTQQKFNQVTVTRTGGAIQTVATPGVLAKTEAVFPTAIELDVDTDTNALSAAQWVLATHQTTSPRLPTVTIDLLAPPSGVTSASLLALDLGMRLSLTPMPSQMWSGTTDYTIEGWTEGVSDTAWTLTINLLPWSLFQVWILGDANYSQLGSTTILGY